MLVKIIGIDPGLAATGIGVISGNGRKIKHYAYGVVRTNQAFGQSVRLEKIYSRLFKLFQEETPDLIIIEDVFSLEKYPQSGITLGKVSGVVLLASQLTGVPVKEIPVREAKQVLTGNGNASKGQLEMSVRQILACAEPIRPSHASDALGLALIGLFRYAGPQRVVI